MTDQQRNVSADRDSQVYVRVWFASRVMFDYLADPQAAEGYAEGMARRFPDLRVTVDPVSVTGTPGLRRMPGERLWTGSDGNEWLTAGTQP